MPKISKDNRIRIYTDKVDEVFIVDVNYTQDWKFQIEIPDVYKERFNATNQELRPNTVLTGKEYRSNRKMIVYAESEEDVKERFKNTITMFAEMSIQKREVMIVTCEASTENTQYTKSDKPKTGLSLDICYATEVSVPGGKPKYYKFTERSGWNKEETETVKSEVQLSWRKEGVLIIDTTDENKQFLENIYENLKRLSDVMKEYTKTNESILELIASKQKLIG